MMKKTDSGAFILILIRAAVADIAGPGVEPT